MTTEITPYREKTSVIIDLQLWLAWRNGTEITLSLLPKIARNRWGWMVQNWDAQLRQLFKSTADGDSFLTEVFDKLENYVFSWREGTRVNPFDSLSLFSDALEFLSLVPFQSIGPSEAEVKVKNQSIQRVAEFQSAHFKEMRKYLRNERDKAFDFVGLGDSTYNAFRGRVSAPFQRNFFPEDLYLTASAIRLESFIDGILLEFKYQKDTEPNLIAFANENLVAGGSSVRMEDIFASFYQVPFEQSLEQMSKDYLGTTERWFELVTANKLKAPYVDLFGEKLPLKENASGSTVRVNSAQKAKYRINTAVKIGSRLVPEEVRTVENVNDNLDGTANVSLSGKPDLAKLKLAESSYMRVYKPDTLKDFSFVKIPTTATAPYANIPEPSSKELKQLDKALYSFGVDIERDDRNGDLILSSSGDLSLVFGLKAVRQAVINVVRTELGQLPLHPEYGLPQSTGIQMEGADTAARVGVIIESALARDQRFTNINVNDIVISAEGNISVSLAVRIAGSSQILPLAFVI